MTRRASLAALGLLALAAAMPAAAGAHGLVSRSDLPIPEVVFFYAGAGVLVVSFLALASMWPEPKLEDGSWRPLPRAISRVLVNPVTEALCGAFGVFLLGLVIYSGFAGVETQVANFAPVFVYVIFWVGLVPVSLLFGDVFRAFNPWRAVGRAVAGVARIAARGELPAPLEYPERLGRWPAAIAIFLFAVLELVASGGTTPQNVAIATVVYSAATFVAMSLYGVDTWIDRGEGFSVYFNLFSRMSPIERRGSELGLRRPLSGLAALAPLPGTVALLAVMIGSVSFDGASEAQPWTDIAPEIADLFEGIGLSPERALEASYLIGLTAMVLLIYGFYRLGVKGMEGVGGGFSTGLLANRFVHSLVPIAFAYVAAHYFTYLLFEGQRLGYLISDPLGEGSDIFGTADKTVDFTIIGANATWYWQVGFVVGGHVAGLILAHDRAIAMYKDAKQGVRSQYWMLFVMVVFTGLALWLLSQANA